MYKRQNQFRIVDNVPEQWEENWHELHRTYNVPPFFDNSIRIGEALMKFGIDRQQQDLVQDILINNKYQLQADYDKTIDGQPGWRIVFTINGQVQEVPVDFTVRDDETQPIVRAVNKALEISPESLLGQAAFGEILTSVLIEDYQQLARGYGYSGDFAQRAGKYVQDKILKTLGDSDEYQTFHEKLKKPNPRTIIFESEKKANQEVAN